MTVSAQTPINRSTGNGVTTVFPYTFKIIKEEDIEVSVDDVVKTLNVDFTVTGAGDDTGGNVVMTAAPAASTKVIRRRAMSIVRTTDYQDQGTLPADTLDNDLDATVMMIQQVEVDVGRAIKYPASDSAMAEFPSAESRANKLLAFDAAGLFTTANPVTDSSTALRADLSASSGASLIGWIRSVANAVATTVAKWLGWQPLSLFNFMTDAEIADVQAGTRLINVYPKLVLAAASGKKVIAPAGIYRSDSTWTINGSNGFSLVGEGAALVSTGVRYPGNTVFSFDSAPSGSDGLVITNFVGLTLKDFVVSHRRIGVGGGRALALLGGHDFELENIKVDSLSSGAGVVLGGGTGATCAFLGSIKNVKVLIDGGTAIRSNATNTSLTFEACYQIGGKFEFNGTTYSTLNSMASEAAPLFGYNFNDCSNMVINACGGEMNGRGLNYLQSSCCNMVFNAPKGISNNTVNGAAWGELFEIDSSSGACKNITINNPASVNPGAATLCNIHGTTLTGDVFVNGAKSDYLSKGISGDATWALYNLVVTGGLEKVSFTPTLAAGWTLVGIPTITGFFYRNSRRVKTFSITITPATSIKANAGDRINLPWFVDVTTGATVVDGNAGGYVSATVAGSSIYMTATPILTVPITISGQVFVA